MTNINAVYPSGIFTWTDRVDGVSTDLAEDINAVAAEVISVETTVGSNAQIEPSPPTGLALTYNTLSARVSDAMNNANLPVSFLFNTSVSVPANTSGNLNQYVVSYDPYNMYNGTDITIPINGWWVISSEQTWSWSNNGYVRQFLALNGSSNQVAESVVDWQFSGNVNLFSAGGTQSQTVIIGPPIIPRWRQFGNRPRMTGVMFQGPLHSGDRISVYSENGTSNPSLNVSTLTLKASCTKKITGTFTSG